MQITEKRREAKGKEEKERYTHLKAELQRKGRRDQDLSQEKEMKKGKMVV